jgi:hypothetical protein
VYGGAWDEEEEETETAGFLIDMWESWWRR